MNRDVELCAPHCSGRYGGESEYTPTFTAARPTTVKGCYAAGVSLVQTSSFVLHIRVKVAQYSPPHSMRAFLITWGELGIGKGRRAAENPHREEE
jgi:hypothetical protein